MNKSVCSMQVHSQISDFFMWDPEFTPTTFIASSALWTMYSSFVATSFLMRDIWLPLWNSVTTGDKRCSVLTWKTALCSKTSSATELIATLGFKMQEADVTGPIVNDDGPVSMCLAIMSATAVEAQSFGHHNSSNSCNPSCCKHSTQVPFTSRWERVVGFLATYFALV